MKSTFIILLMFIITLIIPHAFAQTIEGTLLMLDDKTPHVAVPVQVISICRSDPCGRQVATVLSDERRKYQFINLKPG